MLVTRSNFNRILRRFRKCKRVVVDVETTGLRVHQGDRVIGVAMRAPGSNKTAYYFPVRHQVGSNLAWSQYTKLLKFLSSPGLVHTGWNYKFDIKMLMADGMECPPYAEDVMLAAHLLNENEINYKLKDWSDRYLDENSSKASASLVDLLSSRGLGKGDMQYLLPEELEDYATQDVHLTERARQYCREGLLSWKLWRLWTGVNQYMLATTRMELRGIQLDVPLIKKYIKEATRESEKSFAVLKEMAGYDINPRSNPQMQAFLGLPSTAAEFLEPYHGQPAVDAVVNYRGWAKVNSSYYLPYLEKMDSNHVLYPNIKLHGTVSGRPSAEDPNLQAVPRKTLIYKVKNVLRARSGFKLVSGDYSQAELRFAVTVTKDPGLKAAFESGEDIHQHTADMTGLDRDTAKRINFGVVYGIGAPGLSKKLKKPQAEAARFLNMYHGRFKMIKPTYRELDRLARSQGYIRLWTGRVRRYYTQRYPEPHKALSNTIQGGVSEVMRHAITAIDREMHSPGGRLTGSYMLMQVHDQIVFEVPDELVDTHIPIINELMTTFDHHFVTPFKVDFSVGESWGSLQQYTIPKRKSDESRRKRTRDGAGGGPVRVRRKGRRVRPSGQKVSDARQGGRS